MNSRLALQAKAELLAATQRLTPEERLNAFLRHCRLMMELRRAGGQSSPGPGLLRSPLPRRS
jgi:hypothetical protein